MPPSAEDCRAYWAKPWGITTGVWRVTTAAVLLLSLALCAGCAETGRAATRRGDRRDNRPADLSAGPTARPTTQTPTPEPVAGRTAVQIWKLAKKSAAQASSVHVVVPDILLGKTTISADLYLTKEQPSEEKLATGTMLIDGYELSLRRVGEWLYFKDDSGYLESHVDQRTAERYAGRWFKESSFSGTLHILFFLTDLQQLPEGLLDLPQHPLVLVPGTVIDGQDTIGLSDEYEDYATPTTPTIYVERTGAGLPLRLIFGTDSTKFISFQNWNAEMPAFSVPGDALDFDPDLRKQFAKLTTPKTVLA
jgi:hypothetical protein